MNITNIMGIYRIVNKLNGKIYIGSSKDINKRWNKHISDLKNNKHHSTHLQQAWNKYGEENFVFEMIEIVNNENSLHDREQHWINETKCYDKTIGYNMSPFANNPSTCMYVTYTDGNVVKKDKIQELINMKMSNNEKLVYYTIRDIAVYPSNCVMINDSIPSIDMLVDIVGLSERAIRSAIKQLEERKLIKLIQSGHRKAIYINPYFYATGKTIDNETMEIFN